MWAILPGLPKEIYGRKWISLSLLLALLLLMCTFFLEDIIHFHGFHIKLLEADLALS